MGPGGGREKQLPAPGDMGCGQPFEHTICDDPRVLRARRLEVHMRDGGTIIDGCLTHDECCIGGVAACDTAGGVETGEDAAFHAPRALRPDRLFHSARHLLGA
jgi:hypothetical protein